MKHLKQLRKRKLLVFAQIKIEVLKIRGVVDSRATPQTVISKGQKQKDK